MNLHCNDFIFISHEEYQLLGYNAVYSVECQSTFRRNMLAGFLLKLFLRPWRWRRYFPLKRRLTLNVLQGAISQKLILFITTAVKTSNPTCISHVLAVGYWPGASIYFSFGASIQFWKLISTPDRANRNDGRLYQSNNLCYTEMNLSALLCDYST
jgi:hypothetical protein